MKRHPSFIPAVLLSILWLTGCGAENVSRSDSGANVKVQGEQILFTKDAPQLASIKVEEARTDVPAPLMLTGRLVWDEDRTARVFSPVSGRILSIHAASGQKVAAGALLARLTSPDFGQAHSDAARAQADLSIAEKTRDRLARLVERGAAPRKELESAEADLARARIEVDRASSRLARWGGEAGRKVDEVYEIRAPVAGTIVERNVNPGLEVTAVGPVALFVISDPQHLWIALDVPEKEAGAVEPGAKLSIKTPVFPGRTFAGTLTYAGSSLDPVTRILKSRGAVENPDSALKAEMYVTAELTRRGDVPVTTVPSRAVLAEGDKRFLFSARRPGEFERKYVTVGLERDGKLTVLSGLNPGEPVVSEGSILLASLLSSGSGS